MPLFDFKCRKCDRVFEAFQRADHDGRRTETCSCGGMAERVWTSGASFVFTFRDGFDVCTGEYHPTKKHYEECKFRKGLVKA